MERVGMRLAWLCAVLGGCHLGSAEVEVTCEDWAGGCADMDRDGFTGDADCDPSNGAINPSAADVSGDDIDQNCDGEDGIAGAGTVVDEDQDNDGYRSDEECDDGNGAINPSATDVQGDGIDQDCDGIDGVDGDGDGQAAWWSAGPDCDDGDAAIYAGADDPGGDGIDSDCDGDDGTIPGPGTFYGDLTLGSVGDLDWFCASYDRIVGTLTLAEGLEDLSGLGCLVDVSGSLTVASGAASLELPLLERVGGDLALSPTLSVLSLPSLVEVGGDLTGSAALSALSLPLLVEVGGAVYLLVSAPVLTFPALERAGRIGLYTSGTVEIALPALAEVADVVEISGDGDGAIDLSALVTVSYMYISNYYAAEFDLQLVSLEEASYISLYLPIGTLTLNRLASVDRMDVFSTISSGQINLPALTSIDYLRVNNVGVAAPTLTQTGQIYLDYGVDVASFAALTTVDSLSLDSTSLTHLNGFSALRTVTGDVYLYGNGSLVSVAGLEGLTSFNTFTFYYNYPITDTDLSDLMTLLGSTNYYIYGNG